MAPKKTQLRRPDPNNPQIREYTDAIRRGQKSYQVRAAGRGWIVRQFDGSYERTFPSKEDAVSHARSAAEAHASEMFIYGKDGRIVEHASYAGNAR
jgi:hypothetical protein